MHGKEFRIGVRMSRASRRRKVTGIRPEKLAEYQGLHADDHAGVRDLIAAAHMRNFSIYLPSPCRGG